VPADYQEILDTAIQAAAEAGDYLKSTFGQRPDVEFKGRIDLVTERDRQSQEKIYRLLKTRFPGHSILAEEELDEKKDKESLWLIDPLDGTTNYAHTLPAFCVSIAFFEQGQPRVGVVYAPVFGEMFQAVRGGGAFLNGKRIAVSTEKELGKSLLATGFPYDLCESEIDNIDHFTRLLKKAQAIRRWGSAALDLCYTAAGRFDGFWELKLFPWDTAAGMLMVEEAGGTVSDFSGRPFQPFLREIVASNGPIHRQILSVLQSARPQS